jgi:hypothetical protein
MTAMHISIAVMMVRMKLLAPCHRIAHLRALIRRAPEGSVRRYELVALLHDQLTAPRAHESRAP